MLDKTTTVNLLFDYYHILLKDQQKQVLEMYYHDDLSLGEIAELQNKSRQAVYDQLKRAEKTLFELEEKLHLLARDQKRQALLQELETYIDIWNRDPSLPDVYQKIRNTIQDLKAIDS
ncbi:MAG: YlxM family DNA-binding protein [Bacillaceae bacterium]|nr:YlxM family DNA-binding protein [Bacillaceae bacterium]